MTIFELTVFFRSVKRNNFFFCIRVNGYRILKLLVKQRNTSTVECKPIFAFHVCAKSSFRKYISWGKGTSYGGDVCSCFPCQKHTQIQHF